MTWTETEAYWHSLTDKCCQAELDEALPVLSGTDPSLNAGPGTDELFQKIVSYTYKHLEVPEHWYKKRLAQYAQALWAEAERGYGSPLLLDQPDTGYLAKLNRNAWQFAAAKTYSELTSIARQLTNDDGVLRSFNEFQNQAYKVTTLHNHHFKTEKATVFAAAQMAKKWQTFNADANRFPLIEFDAIIDNHTTELCKSLDRIVVPVGHPYLQIYWPPNHFFCRLNVRQLTEGTPTPADKLPYPEIPKNFKTNFAANGKLLPDTGGYFTDMPQEWMTDDKTGWVSPLYSTAQGFDKGLLRTHDLTDANKKNQHIELGTVLAQKGHRVDLLPEIHSNDKDARKLYFPELATNNFSNPDTRINGILADFKIPDAETIDNRTISNAIKETDNKGISMCVIDLVNKNYRMQTVLATLRGVLKDNNRPNIKTVWLVLNDNVIMLPREIITNKNFFKIIQAF